MSGREIYEIVRLVAVIALVVLAAALATPPGRLPLALRGIARIMRKDAGRPVQGNAPVSATAPIWKRILAFALVLLAILLAIVG